MKTLFLALFLIVGFSVGNLLIFQNSCKSKPAVGNVENNQKIGDSETPAPTPKTSPAQIKWQPSEYLGITPGKSTERDVKKLLGKPEWEGDDSEEDKDFKKDPEFNKLLQYPKGIEVIVGKKTKITKTIGISYPEITKKEVIAKYGNNYFEIESSESTCIKNNQKNGSSDKQAKNYPIVLVYPENGMSVVVNKDDEIVGIWYSYKCNE